MWEAVYLPMHFKNNRMNEFMTYINQIYIITLNIILKILLMLNIRDLIALVR